MKITDSANITPEKSHANGVVLIDKENTISFICDKAKFILSTNEENVNLLDNLESVQLILKPALEEFQRSKRGVLSRVLIIDQGDRVKQINAEFIPFSDQEWLGCIILLHDQEHINALNADYLAASRWNIFPLLLSSSIHDIRGPINTITMILEILEESLPGNEANAAGSNKNIHDLDRYLPIMKAELKRLNQLVTSCSTQFLSNTDEKDEVELDVLLKQIVHQLMPRARSQKVNLKVQKHEPLFRFCGYRQQIKHALINIILNALETMPNGGELFLSCNTENGMGVLLISDTGPGIPAILHNKIFDLHFSTKVNHLGIGLYVSRYVIEKHGGKIKVTTGSSQGTCLEIILPLVSSINNDTSQK